MVGSVPTITASMFERVTAVLLGGRPASANDLAERQLLGDAVELVVDTVEPKIRHSGGYRQKLEGCVRCTIEYLRRIGRGELEPVLLTRSAWSVDPRVNAFFATPDDVSEILGRSVELRSFFEDRANLDMPEAYALLGMRKQEHVVLAPRLEGEVLKREVAQTTVNFSDHRIVAPTAALAETRQEVGRRIIRLLAQIALSQIVALNAKVAELEQDKASIDVRLRMLKLSRDGMHGVVEDPAALTAKIDALERERKETVDSYMEAKVGLASLDVYLEHIDDVFSHPEQHIRFTRTPLRLDRMGFKVDDTAVASVNELSLAELSIGENLRGAIAIVRCLRSEMPPKVDPVAMAERYL